MSTTGSLLTFSSAAEKSQEFQMAFIGSLVPDQPAFRTPVLNQAGQLYQENLLKGLLKAGVPISLVLSARPLQSYPTGPLKWFKRRRLTLNWGCTIRLLSFLNVTPLKQLSMGMCVIWELLLWRLRCGWKCPLIVYIFNLSAPPIACVYFGARLIRAKCIASVVDINVPGHTVADSPLFRLDFYLQKWFIPLLDGYSAVSDAIAEEFAKGVPWVRVESGVDERVIEHDRTAYQHLRNKHVFTIVAAGTLNVANGFHIILDAFSRLQESHFRLVVAGDGPLAEEVRLAAARDPRIDYRGRVPFQQVLELYAQADVLLNMRLTQTINTRYFFPSKLVEMLATGAPVITTYTAHIEREWSDIAFLLKDETPDALASMFRMVEKTPPQDRERLGQSARRRMLRTMTWTQQGARIADFMKSCLLKRDTPTGR